MMSEPIPESIPTSADPRSKRPTKKRALSPTSKQASQVEALFAKPDRDIRIPDGSAGSKSSLPPPPEIVANVQGSSAGAGSGEFHVYKASRRREYERLRLMEEEVKKEEEEVRFQKARAEREKQDEAKTSKNRKRREKQKLRQQKKKENGRQSSTTPGPERDLDDAEEGSTTKLRLKPHKVDHETKAVKTEAADTAQSPVEEEAGIIFRDED